MKKIIIILSILFTLIVAGVLYGTQDQSDQRKPVTLEQVYMNQYPNPMPDVILNPVTSFVLY